tara:strand:+ start:106 stop:375 length:270 start_codon:yes stop_codon:yes gene_type:complete
MKITPVSPIPPLNNSGSPRYFSQNHTNKETNMSNNNTDTITISESSEDNTVTRDIDYGSLPLNRRFWTTLTFGSYVTALIMLANIVLSS